MLSGALLGCSTARNKGTCDNRTNIRRDVLEARVLAALHERMLDPTLFRTFCEDFVRTTNRLRMEAGAGVEAARSRIVRIDKELDTLLGLILKGGAAEWVSATSAGEPR